MLHRTMLILSLIFSISANSEENALYLSKGTKSPYDGVLLTIPYANEVKQGMLLNESLQTSIDIYQKNEVVYKTEIEQLQTQNSSLTQEIRRAPDGWTDLIYFALGVVVTTSIVYATKK